VLEFTVRVCETEQHPILLSVDFHFQNHISPLAHMYDNNTT